VNLHTSPAYTISKDAQCDAIGLDIHSNYTHSQTHRPIFISMETVSIPLRATPRKRQSTDEEKGLGRKSEVRALLEQDEATDDAKDDEDEEEDLDLDEEGLPYELYKNDTHLPLRAQGGLNIRLWACIAVNALSTIAIVCRPDLPLCRAHF
jgi:hypothetical protein